MITDSVWSWLFTIIYIIGLLILVYLLGILVLPIGLVLLAGIIRYAAWLRKFLGMSQDNSPS